MRSDLPTQLFSTDDLERLTRIFEIDTSLTIEDFAACDPELLADLDVLITGWGSPRIGVAQLDAMPRLAGIFHAAGTVKDHLDDEAWDRGIRVTSAASANAYPVAEYTLAMILLAGKRVPDSIRGYAEDPTSYDETADPGIGNYKRTIGIVGASRVGRRVIELLKPFDFSVLLYDPHLAADDPILGGSTPGGATLGGATPGGATLGGATPGGATPGGANLRGPTLGGSTLGGATLVDLDTLFAESSIVSIHAPLLPETRRMVGAAQLALLPDGATVINTARAPIVDQAALESAVRDRGIRAILDVSEPEPLPADHPLRELPGVVLTPHVAGALGNELRRLGECATREAELFVAGEPAEHPVTKDALIAVA